MAHCKENSLYHILAQVMKLHFHRTFASLDKIGIYPGQPPVLFSLLSRDGQSQKELAEKIKIQPATMTVMLKRMEKVNIVERKVDSNDQRIVRVYLTEEGRRISEEAKKIVETIGEECFADFTEDEEETLKKLLLKMKDNLTKTFEKK